MSTVIKSGQRTANAGVVAFNLDDVSRQGAEYLDKVKAHAIQIVAEANQRAASIAKAAEEQGRNAALDAAHRQLDARIAKQLEAVLPALRQAAAELQQARQDCVSHWEQQALHVAAAIAGRVIRREVERDPQVPLVLIREALELAAGSPHIRLRLNPVDHAALGSQVQQIIAELARLGTADVVADAAITAGGCRVETRFGVIDQQIESQLARIEEELR